MTTLRLAPARRRTSVRVFVVVVVLVALALRVPFWNDPMHPDEAGYLLVAQAWHRGGIGLYGHYWVDRPPGLIGLFKLASATGWLPAVRAMTLPFVALFIVSAAWAASQVSGDRGARWAAVVAAALMSSPLTGSQKADGELFAAAFVMLGVALTIAAVYRKGGPSYLLAFLAGVSAGLALDMKQNFGDVLVFAATLVVVSLVQGRMRGWVAARLLVAGAAGALVVVGLTVAYAMWDRVPVSRLWFDLYGFRTTVFQLITSRTFLGHDGPAVRGLLLVGLAVLCGIVPILAVLLREAWRCQFSGPPIAWAVGVTVVVELFSIAGGGSYWSHYLLELAPMVALSVGIWGAGVRLLEGLGAFAVVSALVSVLVVAVWGAGLQWSNQGTQVGRWLHRVSHPTDTATMLYGIQDAQLASGLRSPYPYLWPLPLRALDPHEAKLRAQLTGSRAPTWVVVWRGLDQWNLDPQDRTRLDIATHYHFARRVCGHGFWLRDGLHRDVSAPVRC